VTPGKTIAIFAYTHNGTDACSQPGVTVNANPQTSVDAVVSNGPVKMTDKGVIGYAEYGPPALNCPLSITGTGTVTSSAKLSATKDWPRKFTRSAICAGHDSNAVVTLTNPSDGIYCSTVRIDVTALRGGISRLTLIAPIVNVPNTLNNFTLATAPALADPADPNNDLVIWQYGAGQNFSFDHNNSGINGVVWIENGNLTYVGNSGTTGFYEAQHVIITGNSYVMHGSGPGAGGGTTTTTVSSTTTTATTTPGTTTGPTTIPGVTTPGSTTPSNTITNTSTVGTTIGLDE